MSNEILSAPLSRRQLLTWGSGTALALVLSQSVLAATPLTVDDFVSFSARLLDRPAKGLNTDNAAAYFENLLATGEDERVASLVGGAADARLERQILKSWYTGLHETGEGDALVTYTDALMWDAIDFTKPMGWCGGETGYWADAPEGEA